MPQIEQDKLDKIEIAEPSLVRPAVSLSAWKTRLGSLGSSQSLMWAGLTCLFVLLPLLYLRQDLPEPPLRLGRLVIVPEGV